MRKIISTTLVLVFLLVGNVFAEVITYTDDSINEYLDKEANSYFWQYDPISFPDDLELDQIISITLTVGITDADGFVDGFIELSCGDSFAFTTLDPGEYTYTLNLDSVDGDFGSIDCLLQCFDGNFYLTSTSLEITYNTPEAAPVPEPATMLLLGTGLLGLAGFRKKKN